MPKEKKKKLEILNKRQKNDNMNESSSSIEVNESNDSSSRVEEENSYQSLSNNSSPSAKQFRQQETANENASYSQSIHLEGNNNKAWLVEEKQNEQRNTDD